MALKYSIGPDGGPERKNKFQIIIQIIFQINIIPEETSWWSSTQVSEVSSDVSIPLEKLLSLKFVKQTANKKNIFIFTEKMVT